MDNNVYKYLSFYNFFKQEMQNFFWISAGFSLLVGQNKQFEDASFVFRNNDDVEYILTDGFKIGQHNHSSIGFWVDTDGGTTVWL